MNRSNLVFTIYGLGRGGTEQQLLALLPRLRQRGWQSEMFLLSYGGALKPDFQQAGFEIREPIWRPFLNGWPSWLQFGVGVVLGILTLAFCTRLGRRGLLVGVLPAGSIAAGLVALFVPKQRHVVLRRNRNHYQAKRRLFGGLERMLNRRAAAVVANSREVARDLLGEGLEADRIAIIPNGVDADRMRSRNRTAARSALGLADEETVFLCVANLIKYKGHFDIVEALSLAKGRLGNWRLLLAGSDQGIGAELVVRAREAGIVEHIVLLGSRDDIPILLAAADVGVLVSHEEGFSNAVLESMAAGLPMIVSDVGGNAEAIGGGEAGIVVPPHNASAIAEALVALGTDKALCMRLGSIGRERAHRLYTFDACVSSFIRVFEAVASGYPVPVDLRPRE